jgi:hypothetical protein
MKSDSSASRQMVRFSLDAERLAAIAMTVMAKLEEALGALRD